MYFQIPYVLFTSIWRLRVSDVVQRQCEDFNTVIKDIGRRLGHIRQYSDPMVLEVLAATTTSTIGAAVCRNAPRMA